MILNEVISPDETLPLLANIAIKMQSISTSKLIIYYDWNNACIFYYLN